MINLEKIIIEGFGPFFNRTEYSLSFLGINIIRGLNGSGKTSILNALCWVLYGQTIKKDASINSYPFGDNLDYRGAYVELHYNKDGLWRKVIHCSDYKGKVGGSIGKNRLVFEGEGLSLHGIRDKRDIWKAITQDIGYSFQLFKTSILFGQKVKRIMDEDGPTRNKTLEEAFEVYYITKAKEREALELDEINRALKTTLDEVNNLSHKKTMLNENLSNLLYLKSTLTEDKARKIAAYKLAIRKNKAFLKKIKPNEKGDLKTKILKINDSIAAKVNEQKKGKDYEDREFRLNLSLNTLRGQLEDKVRQKKNKQKVIWDIKDTCISCGAKLNPTKIKQQKAQIKVEIGGITKEINFLNKTISEQEKEYLQVTEGMTSLNKLKKQIIHLREQKVILEAKINKGEKVLQTIKDSRDGIRLYRKLLREEKDRKIEWDESKVSNIKLELKKVGKRIKKKQTQVDETSKQIDLKNWLISGPLSNNGLKAFIFDSMLEQTNEYLAGYEKIIGCKIHLSMKLQGKRKDFQIRVFRHNEEVPISDLSGGEKQLGDVAILFGIDDTLKATRGFNCLFFDEVFESLDRINVEKVSELLQYKAKGKSVHVITHLEYFNPVGARITEIEKLNKWHSQILQP